MQGKARVVVSLVCHAFPQGFSRALLFSDVFPKVYSALFHMASEGMCEDCCDMCGASLAAQEGNPWRVSVVCQESP